MPSFSKSELKKLKGFLETSGGRKVLLYHQDCDGVCSAALFLKFYKGFEALSRKGPLIEDEFAKKIIEKNPAIIVSLDLPLDQYGEKVEKMSRKIPDCRWVLVDHHVVTKDMNSSRVVHINPRFSDRDAYIPASCIVYELLKKMEKKVEQYVWISVMGTIGDYALQCTNIDECGKIYPELVEPDLMNSKLKFGSDIISSVISAKELEGTRLVLETLLNSEGFESFEGKKELKRIKEKIDEEIARLMNSYEKNKEEYEDIGLVFFEIKTKFGLTAAIDSMLSEMQTDKIVVVYRKSGTAWKVSMRYQVGGINLHNLIRKCLGEKDSGGGHEKAAGGVVQDIGKFKKKIIEELKRR